MATATAAEKTLILEDFSGGLNTLIAPNRLNPNESPANSNVWLEPGTLQKRPGISVTTQILFGHSLMTNAAAKTQINMHSVRSSLTAQTNYFFGVIPSTSGNTGICFSADLATFTTLTVATGTASATSGSAIVAGSGTTWLSNVASGDLFWYASGTFRQIASVDSDTQLTLSTVAGATTVNAAYVITTCFGQNTVTGSGSTAVVGMAARLAFEDMNNKVWMTNTSRTPISFDGTTVANVAAFPKALVLRSMKNYMFAGNYGSTPYRLGWCALKDPTAWPASNFVDVRPDDNQAIVGLVYDGQSLLIIKQNSAFKLTGDIFDPANPTYTLTQVYTPPEFRATNADTFAIMGDKYIFYAYSGFYSYDGNAIRRMNEYDKLQGDWDTIAAALNANRFGTYMPLTQPVGVAFGGRYYMSARNTVITGTPTTRETNNVMYVIERNGNIFRWDPPSGTPVYQMPTDFSITPTGLIGIADVDGGSGTTNDGMVVSFTGTTDYSVAINGTWTSKVFEFLERQRFGLAYVFYKKQSAGNLTVEYSIDEGSFTAVTIDMTAGSVTRAKSAPFVIGQVGNTIQFRLSNNTASQTFEIYGIKLMRQSLRI